MKEGNKTETTNLECTIGGTRMVGDTLYCPVMLRASVVSNDCVYLGDPFGEGYRECLNYASTPTPYKVELRVKKE